MNHLSLLHRTLHPSPHPSKRHGLASSSAAVFQARLGSLKPTPQQRRLAVAATQPRPPSQESTEAAPPKKHPQAEATAAAAEEGGDRTCALPAWALVGGITAGVAAALVLSVAAPPPAAALGPEGPLVEEFWDNMRRYALYALTVSTGVAYTVLQPIVELLRNPVTALLILALIAGGGILLSQVLNAMVGNSDFTYSYAQ